MRSAKKYIDEWREASSVGRSLIFVGKPGTGKTHLAVGIAHEVNRMGGASMYVEMIEMIRAIKETYRHTSNQTEREAISKFVKPDLLIIDEVGHQHGTQTEKMLFFDVINARYNKAKPVIIISNMTLEELKGYMDERIRDRLREGGGRALIFDWESYRGNK